MKRKIFRVVLGVWGAVASMSQGLQSAEPAVISWVGEEVAVRYQNYGTLFNDWQIEARHHLIQETNYIHGSYSVYFQKTPGNPDQLVTFVDYVRQSVDVNGNEDPYAHSKVHFVLNSAYKIQLFGITRSGSWIANTNDIPNLQDVDFQTDDPPMHSLGVPRTGIYGIVGTRTSTYDQQKTIWENSITWKIDNSRGDRRWSMSLRLRPYIRTGYGNYTNGSVVTVEKVKVLNQGEVLFYTPSIDDLEEEFSSRPDAIKVESFSFEETLLQQHRIPEDDEFSDNPELAQVQGTSVVSGSRPTVFNTNIRERTAINYPDQIKIRKKGGERK